jgi:opacity protein-like surface antigen
MMALEMKTPKATLMRLLFAAVLAGAAAPALSAHALAADLPTLPSLAADPETQAPNWKGLYVGAGVDAVFAKGAKGAFGGDVYAGYDHVFDNNVVLGVRFSTGFSPWIVPGTRFQGFDFAETSVKMGYEMGRLTPYVVTGVALARPSYAGGGLANMGDSLNGVFGGPGDLQAAGTAGVGFDYAVTNNLHVGLEATVTHGPGGLAPF